MTGSSTPRTIHRCRALPDRPARRLPNCLAGRGTCTHAEDDARRFTFSATSSTCSMPESVRSLSTARSWRICRSRVGWSADDGGRFIGPRATSAGSGNELRPTQWSPQASGMALHRVMMSSQAPSPPGPLLRSPAIGPTGVSPVLVEIRRSLRSERQKQQLATSFNRQAILAGQAPGWISQLLQPPTNRAAPSKNFFC